MGQRRTGEFRSSRYLGLRHEATSLAPWADLTTGLPASLGHLHATRDVEARLRDWLGCDAVTVSASTLHAFTDIYATSPGSEVLMDEFAYPVAALAAPRRIVRFRHHDLRSLERSLAQCRSATPLVVTDGWCPTCARAAPLSQYAGLVAAAGGRLVVDDTQALGVLGPSAGAGTRFGHGGVGVAAAAGLLKGADSVVVASAAKAFGTPVTLLAGPARVIDRIRVRGPTRTHCSPPSAAHVAALQRALAVNRIHGERLRRRLECRVQALTAALRGSPVRVHSTRFPLLAVVLDSDVDPHAVRLDLRRNQVRTVVLAGHGSPHLVLAVRADHTEEEVRWAAAQLGRSATRLTPPRPRRRRSK